MSNIQTKEIQSSFTSETPNPEERLHAFCSRLFPDAEFRFERLVGDVSTRAYYRVFADGKTRIAAVYPEPFTAASLPYLSVTELLTRENVPIPEVVEVSESEGVVLQSDLGDTRVQDFLETASSDEKKAVYARAVEILLDIQAATDRAISENNACASLFFDEEKLFWELNFFHHHYFTSFLGDPPSPERAALELGELAALARHLANVPRVLCHRDYHSRNFMISGGEVFVIDHQDARMGPASYDLASLLPDPYVELEEGFREELKSLFWEGHAKRFGEKCYRTRKAFEDEYRLMTVQRMLKAVGTFSFQAGVKGNRTYVPYIAGAFRAVERALEGVENLPALRKMVEARISAGEN